MNVPYLDLAPKLQHPLRLWNPLDYLRLLYWAFFFPKAVCWYVEKFVRQSRLSRFAMGVQNLVLDAFLTTVPPVIVRIMRAHRMPDVLLFVGGILCAVFVWGTTSGNLAVGTRKGVRLSALTGFILCVECALLP